VYTHTHAHAYTHVQGMIKWTSGPGQPVFQALSGVLKFDLPLMMFMLPQVCKTLCGHVTVGYWLVGP